MTDTELKETGGLEYTFLEYTSKRKKSFRVSLRIYGVLFIAGGGWYLYHVFTVGMSAGRFITTAIALVFILVGISYLKQSFGITGYDLTYRILPEHLLLITAKGKEIIIPYDTITKVELTKPGKDMDYYMLHIISGKYNMVAHIEGEGELADQMYQQLLTYTEQNDVEDVPGDADSSNRSEE